MSAWNDAYYDLAKRIDDDFSDIDSNICVDLRESNDEYNEMRREVMKIQDDFPAILQVIENDGDVCLSAEESKALVRCLQIMFDMEDMERKQIYFRGHTDCIAYLKKIGAI